MSPDAPAAAPPRKRSNTFLLIVTTVFVFMILLNPGLRMLVGHYTGLVVEPLIGFGGHYPVLTILAAAALTVIATTLVRHFTTDWLEMGRVQAYMRHYNQELRKARKDNNTYRLKVLQDKQPDVLRMQQEMSTRQFKTMPLTMVIVIPLFAWLSVFVDNLDYWWFSAPWNATVDMFTSEGIVFGSSVFPHWLVLYTAFSIPLGALAQKAMKYLSWKERWKRRHPEVHEG